MFDRLSRSWHLVKASWAVLKQDQQLLVFPLISALAALVVVAPLPPSAVAESPPLAPHEEARSASATAAAMTNDDDRCMDPPVLRSTQTGSRGQVGEGRHPSGNDAVTA